MSDSANARRTYRKPEAIKAQQIFLRGNTERIDAQVFDIAAERANRLRGIDHQKTSMAMCRVGDGPYIGHEPGTERHVRNRDQSGPLIHRRCQRVDRNLSFIRLDGPDLDSFERAQIQPEEYVVRVLELGTEHDIVTRPPAQAGGQQVQRLRHVLGDRNLIRVRADQLRDAFSAAFHRFAMRGLVTTPGQRRLHVGVRNIGRGLRNQTGLGDVEVDLVPRTRKKGTHVGRKKRIHRYPGIPREAAPDRLT